MDAAKDDDRTGRIGRRSFWNQLSATERASFAACGTVRRFPAGTVIVHQGDPSEHALVIRSGFVKVVASVPGGAEFILGLGGPGDLIGELASLDGRPRRATVSTVVEVEALMVSGAHFQRLLTEHNNVALALCRVLSERLGGADRYRLAAASVGVAARLARLLLDLSARYGADLPDGRSVGLPLTQHEFAQLLASSPRTVARVLARWRRAGDIRTARRLIVIRRPAVLRAATRG